MGRTDWCRVWKRARLWKSIAYREKLCWQYLVPFRIARQCILCYRNWGKV